MLLLGCAEQREAHHAIVDSDGLRANRGNW